MIQITRNLKTLLKYVGFILRDEQENIGTDDNFNQYSLKVRDSVFSLDQAYLCRCSRVLKICDLNNTTILHFEPHI